MNQILRHFNCNNDFRLDWTLLQNRTREAPQDGVGRWKRVKRALTSLGRELALPPAVLLDAKFLYVLVPIPDQQLLARPDHLAGSVEDLPVILPRPPGSAPRHPGHSSHTWGQGRERKETTGDETCDETLLDMPAPFRL